MKIIMKNFKSWLDKEIILNDFGIILIGGKSGKGKSSILEAIRFVLFGKISKCIHFNKKTCSVEFYHQDLYIKRSKNPNRLLIKTQENTFEDDCAQEIIYKHYGFLFDDISVIPQNPNHNFVFMTPSNKLTFLENFIFNQGIDMDSLGKNIKNNIKKYKDELSNIKHKVGQMETISKSLIPTLISTEEWECLLKKYNMSILKHQELNRLMFELKSYYEYLTKTIQENKQQLIEYNRTIQSKEILFYKWKEWNHIKKDRLNLLTEIEFQCEMYKDKLTKLNLNDLKSNISKYESFERHLLNLNEKRDSYYIDKLKNEILQHISNEQDFNFLSLDDCINKLNKSKDQYQRLSSEMNVFKTNMNESYCKMNTLKDTYNRWIEWNKRNELYLTKKRDFDLYNKEYLEFKSSQEFNDIDIIYTQKKHYESQLKSYNDFQHKKEIEVQLDEIHRQIECLGEKHPWKQHSKQECETNIHKYKEWIEHFHSNTKLYMDIKQIEKELTNYRDMSKTLNELYTIKNVYNCPSCNVSLLLKNDELCISNKEHLDFESIELEIKTLETQQQIYNNLSQRLVLLKSRLYENIDMNSFEEMKRIMLYYETYYKHHTSMEMEKENQLSSFMKDKRSLELKLELYKNITTCEFSWNELVSSIEKCGNIITNYNIYTKKINEYQTKLMNYNLPIAPEPFDSNIEDYDIQWKQLDETYTYNKRICDLNECTLSNLLTNIEELKLIIDYKTKLKEIKDINDTINLIQKDSLYLNLQKNIKTLKDSLDDYNTYNHMYHTKLTEKERIEKLMEEDMAKHSEYLHYSEEILTQEILQTKELHKKIIDEQCVLEQEYLIFQKYIIHTEQYIKYNSYLENIKSTQDEMEKHMIEYKCALELEQIFIQTKYKCMNKTISLLNHSIQKFIDVFFIQDTMVCKLCTLKYTKSGEEKSQINIQIIYKNNECDFQSLSGGEKDRILLAFTLAFSELNHSPFILLDECINSLDQETTEIIMNGIKSLYTGNNIICISHQVIQGMFDQVVNLD